jgi:HTH-type transcriptional regulator/antitoxin MqsA
VDRVPPQETANNLTIDDRLVVVENVPAIVCDHCGEVSFQPEVASRLQKTIWDRKTPARTIEAAVYEFPADASADVL